MFKDPLNRFIHEPARLQLLLTLASINRADFTFLLNITGLSRGNLSVQMKKLEEKGLVLIDKTFLGAKPHTSYSLQEAGKRALRHYRAELTSLLDSAECD